MNKSTRYVFFALLFAVAGFGLYSLMNKQTAITEELPAATEAVDANAAVEQVAQADAPKAEEIIGQEGQATSATAPVKEEEKKDGEIKVEEIEEEVEEPAAEEPSKL